MKITETTYKRAFDLYSEISDILEAAGIDTFDFDGVDKYTNEKYGFELGTLNDITDAHRGQQKYGEYAMKWTDEKANATIDDIEKKFREVK